MSKDSERSACAISVDFPGVRQWLSHGEREGLWDLVVLGDNFEIPAADAYLFGAWNDAYGSLVERLRLAVPEAQIHVAWSSSAYEMETAPPEILTHMGFLGKRPMPKVDGFACLNPDMVDHWPNAWHLPAPIHLDPQDPKVLTGYGEGERSGLALFAPTMLKKNLYSQMLAVRSFQRAFPDKPKDVILHTNLEPYRPVMDALGIRYVLHPWLPRDKYLAVLASCKASLCVSVGESWSYFCVDSLSVNTPVIGSPTIGWLPPYYRVSNPNSPRTIQEALERVWSDAPKDLRRTILEPLAARQNAAARQAIEARFDYGVQVPAAAPI